MASVYILTTEHILALIKHTKHIKVLKQNIKCYKMHQCSNFFPIKIAANPSMPLLWGGSSWRIVASLKLKNLPYGERSFTYQGPSLWNELPKSLRYTESYSSFKRCLKTHLFDNEFSCLIRRKMALCCCDAEPCKLTHL